MGSSSAAIRVWYRLTEALDAGALAAEAGVLGPEEVARSRRFLFAEDRRDFVAAHALLRRALSLVHPLDSSAWCFGRHAGGKPAIAAAQQIVPPIMFNLSHTRGLVACVVARGREVGIDVERADHAGDHDAIADRFFHPSEKAYLLALPEETRRIRFVDLWTLKEAYLKAIGTGLAAPLRDYPFTFGENGTITVSGDAAESARRFNFASFAVGGGRYRLAIAYDGAAMTPTLELFAS